MWECRSAFICECHGSWDSREPTFFDRLESAIRSRSEHGRRLLWWKIVETYTKTQLSFESDALPALSALASVC